MLVVESLALGIDRLKPLILDTLTAVLKKDSIHIRGIYERSDAKVRLQEGLERYKGFIGAPFDTHDGRCACDTGVECQPANLMSHDFYNKYAVMGSSLKQNYYKLNLDCIVILGGNGTQKTANLLREEGLNVIHLPKNILSCLILHLLWILRLLQPQGW